MPQSDARAAQLLERANSLPLTPGVYIMKDKLGKVIYVGKSKKLKNRVSQYFQNSKKNRKTSRMIRFTEDFDYILCRTEIEALSLENTLIKQYSPKYNIRLKDAKSYPYIKITAEEYPRVLYTRARKADRAKYFGPYTGTSTVFSVLDVLYKGLGIPSCKRKFPQDIGKERPCLYYQMNRCCGLCTGQITAEEYDTLIRCATEILRGNVAASVRQLEEQMTAFAELEKYEAAARCRDAIKALRALGQKQHVVATPGTDRDIFGLYTDETCTCISTMYVRDGAVVDKADFVSGAGAEVDSGSLSAFLTEHYRLRDDIPAGIYVGFALEEEDRETLEAYLTELSHHKVTVHRPERGDWYALVQTATANAEEKARQYREQGQKEDTTLAILADMLALDALPERIEAYDISNIGAEHKTCGMIVYENGRFNKQEYRSFRIQSVEGTDDYASMREALERRMAHLLSDSSGSFSKIPDLILIDGGRAHVSVVQDVLKQKELDIPVWGMVKDEYHKTRALCTAEEEINIARERSVFVLIYKIQEEVHRFTVSKTMNAKRSTIKRSSLESIDGIGPVKAKRLLAAFGGLRGVKAADVPSLMTVKGMTQTDALRIYSHFHDEITNEEDNA